MLSNKEKSLSRFLSLVLRHEPQAAGVTLDSEGWADIDCLLEGCRKHGQQIDRAQLQRIVDLNDKKRFTVEGNRIRAAQGHSLESVNLDLVPQQPPEMLFHGTATRFLASIREGGLKKMGRNHVHLSTDSITATAVGSRHGRVVVIPVRAGEMFRDRFAFYLSENKVWLTDHVPPKYLDLDSLTEE